MSGLLLWADPHFGRATHDFDVGGGKTAREVEARRIIDFLTAEATLRDAGVLCLGDVTENRKPPAWVYDVVNEYLARGGHLMRGNHDTFEVDGKIAPSNVFGALRTPSFAILADCNIAILPWAGRAQMAAGDTSKTVAEQHAAMVAAYETIIADFAASAAASDRPTILVCHVTIAGSAYCSDTQPLLGLASEFMLPLPVVAREEFAAVFAGHVHKPQEIVGGACPVIYVGSAVRVDFGEEHQQPRALHVAFSDGNLSIEDIPLPAMEFSTIDVNEVLCEDEMYERCHDAIVRFAGELPVGPESTHLLQVCAEQAMEAGALKIGTPAIRWMRHEVRSEHRMTTAMTSREAVEHYVELTGIYADEPERRDALLALHDELAEERDDDAS